MITLKIDLFSIDDFIKENHCPEVTNPIFFNYDQTPTSDGLFSYELFGISDDDRKNIFGYIDLGGHYIHPMVYSLLSARFGSFRDVLTGSKYAVIADKKIKIVPEDFPGADTGLDFFYDNFDNINWIDALEEDEMDSLDKKTRLKFLKSLDKDEFFVSKWLVLPPFYRAASSESQSMGDSINKLYKELISRTRSMKTGFSISLFGSETRLKIQNTLRDLYLTTMAPASGKNLIFEKGKTEGVLKGSSKNSLIRKHLLGKTVDYTASSVITSARISEANSPNEHPTPFGYSRFPMATLLSLFQPFFVSEGTVMLEEYINVISDMYRGTIKKIDINQFNADYVAKLIKKFIKSRDERFAPMPAIKYTHKDGYEDTIYFNIIEVDREQDLHNQDVLKKSFRVMTLTDFFYIIAADILYDKHVYVTRYPVTNYQNIYPSKIKISTTSTTKKKIVALAMITKDGTIEVSDQTSTYDEYPSIPKNGVKSIDSEFVDVMYPGNTPLAAIGGDYDGDMLYMKSVFSKEANEEADRLIKAKSNILTASGKPSRGLGSIGKDCIMGIYEITKDA